MRPPARTDFVACVERLAVPHHHQEAFAVEVVGRWVHVDEAAQRALVEAAAAVRPRTPHFSRRRRRTRG